MSQTFLPNNADQPKPTKTIEVGKFYFIHDGTKTGHPGLIIKANDQENRYLVIRFDSDKYDETPKFKRGVRHITKLKIPISNQVMNSYVHNRPMLCKRKDIGKKLMGLCISIKDKQTINDVSVRNAEYSPSLRKTK